MTKLGTFLENQKLKMTMLSVTIIIFMFLNVLFALGLFMSTRKEGPIVNYPLDRFCGG